MPWKLPPHEHRTFKRNPLVAVVVQLRFDPILKISSSVPDFQERIRHRFPLYEEREVRHFDVELAVGPGVRVRESLEHRFQCRGEPTTVVLADQSVAIEYRSHRHREVLFEDVHTVFGAVEGIFRQAAFTRLGLRYVNVLRRDTIAADLGRPLSWSDLVKESFLSIPGDLADLDGTLFAHEITSGMPPGEMTVRYGLLPSGGAGPEFRLDVDRYCTEALVASDVEKMVKSFAQGIFSVFMTAAGPSLIEWMEREG